MNLCIFNLSWPFLIFKKNIGQSLPLLGYYCPFFNAMSITVQVLTVNENSIDGMHRIWTWNHRIVATDESTELWRPCVQFTFWICVTQHQPETLTIRPLSVPVIFRRLRHLTWVTNSTKARLALFKSFRRKREVGTLYKL